MVSCCCHPASRLFLLYADGSGTEFLSSRTVEDFLDQAYSDPSVAVLREPLTDTQGVQTGAFQIMKYPNRCFKTQREKTSRTLNVCSRRGRHHHPETESPERLDSVVALEAEPEHHPAQPEEPQLARLPWNRGLWVCGMMLLWLRH